MKTYEQMIIGPYDNDACVESFKELLENPTSEDHILKAWELSMPILGCVMNSHFNWMQPNTEIYEEAISSVAVKLWNLLRSEKFQKRYYIDYKTHFAFIFGICRLEILTAINRLRRHMDVPIFTTQSGVDSSPTAIMFRLFAKELPALIFDYVKTNCRFTGEDRDLCLFVADCFVNDKEIPTLVIRKRWGTRHLGFFQDYVRVLIRRSLWEFRDQFHMMKSVEDTALESIYSTALQDVFGEKLHSDGGEPFEIWWNVGFTREGEDY